MKTALGLLLGLSIGAACRWFSVPVPAPPTVIGALLVVSITVGYLIVDRALGGGDARPAAERREARTGGEAR